MNDKQPSIESLVYHFSLHVASLAYRYYEHQVQVDSRLQINLTIYVPNAYLQGVQKKPADFEWAIIFI